jgi:uncharacterized protein (DUF2267 family)
MRWTEFVADVRERGQYGSAEEAERIVRVVLTALGGFLPGPERDGLARLLPQEAAAALCGPVPGHHTPAARDFVDGVAGRLGDATPMTARWDVGSVLSAVADAAADDAAVDRVVAALPAGWALLFGRGRLTTVIPAPNAAGRAPAHA